jgi:hypothetical protein
MKKPKLKHRPRRLRGRPLLVAAAVTLSTITGCEHINGTVAQEQDLSVQDSAPMVDLGLKTHD